MDIEADMDNGTSGSETEDGEWNCGVLLFFGPGYCFS